MNSKKKMSLCQEKSYVYFVVVEKSTLALKDTIEVQSTLIERKNTTKPVNPRTVSMARRRCRSFLA
jgi:hypothetical protein